MKPKLFVLTAGALTLIAMGVSLAAEFGSLADQRDQSHDAAAEITRDCSALREESFRYEEAKRNALAAYEAGLGLRRSSEGRNLNFRRLLAGSSAGSFIKAIDGFAEALDLCEGAVGGDVREGGDETRTERWQVKEKAGQLAEILFGGQAAETESASELLEALEKIDSQLAERSGRALRSAAERRAEALRDALESTGRIARLSSLALLIQMLATGVVMAKDLVG